MKENFRGPFQSYNCRIFQEILTKLENNGWFFFELAAQERVIHHKSEALRHLPAMSIIIYESEPNENLKSAIKIRNTAPLSCKLTTMILMVWRVADRWQYDAGMQHDGAVVV